MLKTISAALIAASLIAAPAFAADTAKPEGTIKPVQTIAAQTSPAKSNVLNANAKMERHHVTHRHHRHHRFHKHMGALHGAVHAKHAFAKHAFGKAKVAKLNLKRTVPATRRG